jgi:hypothetical protein
MTPENWTVGPPLTGLSGVVFIFLCVGLVYAVNRWYG